jgi:hypothetical protein
LLATGTAITLLAADGIGGLLTAVPEEGSLLTVEVTVPLVKAALADSLLAADGIGGLLTAAPVDDSLVAVTSGATVVATVLVDNCITLLTMAP